MTIMDTTYQKNVNTGDPFLGNAIVTLVLAATVHRQDIREGVLGHQYDHLRGVGILVSDAGVRQHLANALRFDKTVTQVRTLAGTGSCRSGKIEGVDVTIWNEEL